jgi:hypothetical protein
MFNTIRTQLKAVLNTLTGAGKLSIVYEYHEGNLASFPSATFDVSDVSNDFLTNAENIRQYSWKVFVYQDIQPGTVDLSDAVRILDNVCDDIIQAIETNLTLNSTCDYSRPAVGPRMFMQSPQGEMLVQELTIITVSSALV